MGREEELFLDRVARQAAQVNIQHHPGAAQVSQQPPPQQPQAVAFGLSDIVALVNVQIVTPKQAFYMIKRAVPDLLPFEYEEAKIYYSSGGRGTERPLDNGLYPESETCS